MDTESTKSDILEINATPTIHTVMIVVSTMTEVITEMKNVVKATEEDRKKRILNNHKSKEKKQRRNIE